MNLFTLFFYVYLWIDYSTTYDWTSKFKIVIVLLSTPSIIYEIYYIVGMPLFGLKYLLNNSIDFLIPGLCDYIYKKYNNVFIESVEKNNTFMKILNFFVGCDDGHFNCYFKKGFGIGRKQLQKSC